MTSLAGRPPKEPARSVSIRMPESLYAELMVLRAEELMTTSMNTKYGAITSYITRLVREDLERHKEKLRNATKYPNEGTISLLKRQAE